MKLKRQQLLPFLHFQLIAVFQYFESYPNLQEKKGGVDNDGEE